MCVCFFFWWICLSHGRTYMLGGWWWWWWWIEWYGMIKNTRKTACLRLNLDFSHHHLFNNVLCVLQTVQPLGLTVQYYLKWLCQWFHMSWYKKSYQSLKEAIRIIHWNTFHGFWPLYDEVYTSHYPWMVNEYCIVTFHSVPIIVNSWLVVI